MHGCRRPDQPVFPFEPPSILFDGGRSTREANGVAVGPAALLEPCAVCGRDFDDGDIHHAKCVEASAAG